MKYILTILIIYILIPSTAYAGIFDWFPTINIGISINTYHSNTLQGFLYNILGLIGMLIPILIALAVVLFVYGLVKYLITDSSNEKKQAIQIITYGIISLFVMVSVWGLVFVIQRTFGVAGRGAILEEQPIRLYMNDFNKIT